MRDTPGSWCQLELVKSEGRGDRTFGAPIAVDGEDEDAFRRQVGEVGEDAEDLS
jgi:hypothetical protein